MNRNLLTGTFSGAFHLLLVIVLTLSTMPVLVVQAAVLTVNSTADAVDASPGDGVCATAGGVCTLRAAIQEANALAGDDTLLLPSGTYTLTIANPGGLPEEDAALTGDLDITSNLVISATGATRPIVDGNGDALTDREFHILNSSTVSILGVDIRGGGNAGGGGICPPFCVDGAGIDNSNGSTLTLSDSTLSDNWGSQGGAIHNSGIMMVTNVTLSSNFADGAGIGNVGTMTVTNSTINGNTGGASGSISNVGTLTLISSFVLSNTGTGIGNYGFLTLNNSVVSGNVSGGIRNSGVMTATNSTISDNTAPGNGGGIKNDGIAILKDSTVSGNTTTDNTGGGIYNGGDLTVNNSTLNNNTASHGGGGAISNENGTVTMNNSVVYGNTASGGGGIGNSGYDGIMTLNNSTISSNTAGVGGGIYVSYATLILNSSTVSGNMTFASNGGGDGGGILNVYGAVTLNNSTVSGNVLSIPAGAYCGVPSCNGGGIFTSGPLTLSNSTVSGNVISGSECGGLSCSGGGIYIFSSGAVHAYNTTISNNTAPSTGGGLVNNGTGTTTLANTILAGNSASQTGPDCYWLPISSSGYNLIGNTVGCPFTASTGDVLDQSAGLGSLMGRPGYHPLLPGSPAIDAGNPAGCVGSAGPLTTDERGALRPMDGNIDGDAICDIGAYEFDPNNPLNLSLTKIVSALNPQPRQPITYTILIANDGLGNATSAVLSDILPTGLTLAGPVTLNPPGIGTVGAPPNLVTSLTLAAGQAVTITVPVLVNTGQAAGTVITNSVVLTSAEVTMLITASVAITVADAPLAARNDFALTAVNTPITIYVLDNDGDPNGDPATITAIGTPLSGTVGVVGASLVYTPTLGFLGTDTFTYTVSTSTENASATVTVLVAAEVFRLYLPLIRR